MKDHARVIAPPPLIYAMAFVPGWFIDRAMDMPALPGFARVILAALFIAPGLLLAAGAFRAMHRARTTPNPYGESTAIVTDGPFRYTRNPLYLTLALFYSGLAIAMDAPLALLVLPLALLVIHYGVITREERYLERKFGAEYLRYKARVRRWI